MPMKSEYAIETPDECRGSDNRQFTTLTLTTLPLLLISLSPTTNRNEKQNREN